MSSTPSEMKKVVLNSFIDTKNTRAILKYFQLLTFKFAKHHNFGLSLDDAGELYKAKSIHLIDLFVPPSLSERYLGAEQVITAEESQSTLNLQNIVDIIQAHPRCFILGDPGAGKTTLIQWLSLALANSDNNLTKMSLGELVPFALILRELPLHNVQTFEELWQVFAEKNQEEMQAFDQYSESYDVVKTLLTSGQGLILLDGLDEITNVKTRKNLVNAVQQGMRDYPQCKFLISSRVVGFDISAWQLDDKSDAPASLLAKEKIISDNKLKSAIDLASDLSNSELGQKSALPTFYLAPFSSQQAQKFVSNWYKQYQPQLDASHQNRVSELFKRINENDGLGRLSRTPVLLNMICFIHARRGRLPHGRVELYQRISETYLVGLDNARGIQSGGKYAHQFDYADRCDWLGEIAYTMQTNRSAKDNESAILISEAMVKKILTEKLTRLDIEQNHINDEINLLLQQFAQRSGLFLPRGKAQNQQELYGFNHLSFLEYFAAKAIKPKLDLGDLTWANLTKKTQDTWWHETLILFFEQIEQFELAEKYLDRLLPNESIFKKTPSQKLLNRLSLLSAIVMDSGIKLSINKRKEVIDKLWQYSVYCINQIHTNEDHNFFDFNYQPILQSLLQTEYGARDIGVKYLKSLIRLDLLGLDIHDLSWISELTLLQNLSLRRSVIGDISALSGLTQLRNLNLSHTAINDISVLSGLTQLRNLNLSHTGISDITVVSGLKELKSLFLGNTAISDLRAVSGLTQLNTLVLSGEPISDISALSRLTQLKTLVLYSAAINDISVLSRLTQLETLHLSSKSIKDISVLSGLTQLQYLALEGSAVSDVTALSGLTQLLFLDLSNTAVSDVSALHGLTQLSIWGVGEASEE